MKNLLVYIINNIFYNNDHYSYNDDINDIFCKKLDKSATGLDIFQKVDTFFTKMVLQWKVCVAVCTDGAAPIRAQTASFQGRLQSASDVPITLTHCIIHQESLVAKKLSPDFNIIVQEAVKVINFIPEFLQIYVMRWYWTTTHFYCIVK